MADAVYELVSNLRLKLHDNGDNTYSLVTYGGGGASTTEYTEDAASAANPAGPMLMARRRDTPTTAEVTAEGDNIALNADSKGQLRTNVGKLPQPIVKTWTLTVDTSILASGDVIGDTEVITNVFADANDTGVVISCTVYDKDDQGTAIDILFFDANVALGTENSAPSISDANTLEILGEVVVEATDWKDMGGARYATKKGSACGFGVRSISGTTSLGIALICRSGTPTYTAGGLSVTVTIV